MKRLFTLILSCILLFSTLPVSAAAQRDLSGSLSAADKLNSLGLFNGTGTDVSGNPIYELERKPTRAEALVMLIRTLGKDSAARAGNYNHPFTDVPSWADIYVGYAYENGLANGVSATLFGAGNTAEGYTYLTFMLRALGYSDTGGADFTWDNPFELAREIGILPAGVDTMSFLRADVATVSLAALSATLKTSDVTLIGTLVSAGAVDAAAAEAAGFSVMDARSDAFCYEQDDNFVNSGMTAWDENGSYFIYAEQYLLNNSITKEYHVVRKNGDSSAEILYTADVGARISSLSVHQGKLYFIEDSPGNAASVFARLTELDPATGKTSVLFSTSSLSYYTWYDGVFYVLYTSSNFLSGSYSFASVNSSGTVSALLSGLSWNDTISFRAYGQNGNIYILSSAGSGGKTSLTEYDLAKKTSSVLLSESMTNTLFRGDTFYYSNFDKADEGVYTVWRVKLDAPLERVAVGDLPQAGQLYFHNGQLYFRSYLLQKLLSMDMAGNLEVVKPYLNPDSAICFFDHYALLPSAGLIVSDHCEADLLDLNTGELIPYGAYLGFTFWREGAPYDPGENKAWHEEEPEKTATPYGKALQFYFEEDGLVIEYSLVNPTAEAVEFLGMNWSVSCKGCDSIQFADYLNVSVAPGSEYVFSMVFPEVPECSLTDCGFDYSVNLTFD